MKRFATVLPTVALAGLLTACGGGPDYNAVRADIKKHAAGTVFEDALSKEVEMVEACRGLEIEDRNEVALGMELLGVDRKGAEAILDSLEDNVCSKLTG